MMSIKNSEGYTDLTAYLAIKNVTWEEKQRKKLLNAKKRRFKNKKRRRNQNGYK